MLISVHSRFLCLLATAVLTCSLTGMASAEGETTTAKKTAWPQRILAAMQEDALPSDALSLAAVPLNGPGKARYVNADRLVSAASTMKLITTYAALELLGPTFQWNTRLYTDGTLKNGVLHGNLYFVGVADPKLTQERLWLLLRDLRDYGVRQIHGNLILDGSYFHLPHGLPHFVDDDNDPYAPYLVEPNALLTNLNVFHFQIAARADKKVQAWVRPAVPQLTLDNQVTLTTAGSCPPSSHFHFKPHSDKDGHIIVTITGRLPEGCRSGDYLSLMSPEAYTAALIRSLWKSLGGTLTGQSLLGRLPVGAQLLATSSSPDLVTMVRDINKWSSNIMARQLFLVIGAENRLAGDSDDLHAARRTVREWLAHKGIDTSDVVLDNGSGLSRIARITPRQQIKLLEQAWRSPYAAELISSLPLVAMDGTMRHRLRNTEMRGEGHIKTGTLTDVRAVAGFTRDRNNTTWAVSAMINTPSAWKGLSILDRILLSVHHLPEQGDREVSGSDEQEAPSRSAATPGG